MSMQRRFMCGVPESVCVGGRIMTSTPWIGSGRAHVTREEAYKCRRRYLLSQGYTQLSRRDFRPPDGGPILVLPKLSRFGGELRRGKTGKGEKGRFMWKHRNSGGLIE